MCAFVHLCIRAFVHVRIFAYVHSCIFVFVYMCICAYVRVHNICICAVFCSRFGLVIHRNPWLILLSPSMRCVVQVIWIYTSPRYTRSIHTCNIWQVLPTAISTVRFEIQGVIVLVIVRATKKYHSPLKQQSGMRGPASYECIDTLTCKYEININSGWWSFCRLTAISDGS